MLHTRLRVVVAASVVLLLGAASPAVGQVASSALAEGATASAPAEQVATAAQETAAGPDLNRLCAKLQRTPARVPLCTHGPDTLAALGSPDGPPPSEVPADLAAMCSDGGVTGKRIEVLYGVPQDRKNRYSEMLTTMQNVLAQVDGNLDASDDRTSQHYRFLCENGTDVTIRNLTLLPVGPDLSFTFDDFVESVQQQVAERARAKGLRRQRSHLHGVHRPDCRRLPVRRPGQPLR